MSNRSPNPVDQHVGKQIRLQRLEVGMSQTQLGNALGITFQQVQKYEKGINRVGAGRLQQIAVTLKVPPESFFDLLPKVGTKRTSGLINEFLALREGVALARAFIRLDDKSVRRSIVTLVERIGDL